MVCPSGKMPFTLPYSLADSPAHRYGEYQAKNCKYNEDIYVGYRGFEKVDVKAGDTERVSITVAKDDLRVWNDGWTLLHGSYTVYVAAASDDVRLKSNIKI